MIGTVVGQLNFLVTLNYHFEKVTNAFHRNNSIDMSEIKIQN